MVTVAIVTCYVKKMTITRSPMIKSGNSDQLKYNCWKLLVNVHITHCNLTLLTKRSVWSKCRPYIFGASPGADSIFTHTSIPLRASVSGLWFASMPVTTPISKNYKTQTQFSQPFKSAKKMHVWLSFMRKILGDWAWRKEGHHRSFVPQMK